MFDFVLNNTKPIVFPDKKTPDDDGFVYDPANGTAYSGEYQYRWGQNKWVSHLNIFSLALTDSLYVLVPGDKMTGGLMMGTDIKIPEIETGDPFNRPVRRFIVSRYNLNYNSPLQSDQIRLRTPHIVEGTQAINYRLTITKHAEVYDFNRNPLVNQKWYRLSILYNESGTPLAPEIPTDSQWEDEAVEITSAQNKTQYLLTSDDLNTYIRSVEFFTDQSNGSQVSSVVDSQLIRSKP